MYLLSDYTKIIMEVEPEGISYILSCLCSSHCNCPLKKYKRKLFKYLVDPYEPVRKV